MKNRLLKRVISVCVMLAFSVSFFVLVKAENEDTSVPKQINQDLIVAPGDIPNPISQNVKLSYDLSVLLNGATIFPAYMQNDLIDDMVRNNQYCTDGDSKADSQVPRVYVYIYFNSGFDIRSCDSFFNEVTDRDADNGLIAAWVEVAKLDELSARSEVRYIETIQPPLTNTGLALSQGDSLHRANLVRSVYGQLGAGMKVGIISNGVDHLQSAVNTGDLPNDVSVLGNSYGGDEGTAMLEIVHDLAPSAKLYFHDSGTNQIAFNGAIDELISAGCTVICDDVVWVDAPFFEDSIVGKHVDSICSANNIIYITSAGNYGNHHYQNNFYSSLTVGQYYFHDYNPGGVNDYLMITLKPGEKIDASLQWNDQWGQSSNDYDLLLYSSSGGVLLWGSFNPQTGTQNPAERLIYVNNSASSIGVDLFVGKKQSAQSKTIELILFSQNSDVFQFPGTFLSPTNAIYGHAASAKTFTVGAINASTPTQIATYSSQGPVTLQYPTLQTRNKPDICGIDGVSITGAGGFRSPFYGTSAAAPHVAALCALAWAQYPTKTAEEIKTLLKDSAVDLGALGADNVYGSGKADIFDTFWPEIANAVFATSITKKTSDIVAITSSGIASNTVWLAPNGTTNFTAGPTMTKSASGTSTSIYAPTAPGDYKLYVVDSVGHVSPASSSTLTVIHFLNGSGTQNDPYQINTAAELIELADRVNGATSFSGYYFKLNHDIDLSANDWVPIGNSSAYPFSGNFNGGEHRISNLKIGTLNAPASFTSAGLFGYAVKATIENLDLDDTCNVYNTGKAGGIAGKIIDTTLTNCHNEGDVSGSGTPGGIVGEATGNTRKVRIDSCSNKGSVTGKIYDAGGILGTASNAEVSNCFNEGDLNAVKGDIGGIVGGLYYSTIVNCYNTGALSCGVSASLGGITGEVYSNSTLANCYNTGAVNGNYSNDTMSGGISGSTQSSNIKNCYNIGTVTSLRPGGIMGSVFLGTTQGCYYLESSATSGVASGSATTTRMSSEEMKDTAFLATMNTYVASNPTLNTLNLVNWKMSSLLNGGYPVLNEVGVGGGGAGTLADPFIIATAADLKKLADEVNAGNPYTGVYFALNKDIDLHAYDWVPIGSVTSIFSGIFDGNGFTIQNMHIGTAENPANKSCAGLFGYIQNAELKNIALNEGCTIYVSATSLNVGGIVGYSKNSAISICSYSGKISATGSGNGSSYVAGIAGMAKDSSRVASCNNTGQVVAVSNYCYVGGIIGGLQNSIVLNSYNTGELGGKSTLYGGAVGGIAAKATEHASIISSYNCSAIRFGSDNSGTDIGGIAGLLSEYSTAANCYNKGSITSTTTAYDYVGGIVGSNMEFSTVESCYNTGLISGNGNYVAAIAGNRVRGIINNTFYLLGSALKGAGGIGGCTTVSLGEAAMKKMDMAGYLSFYAAANLEANGIRYATWGYSSSNNEGYPVLSGVGDGEGVSDALALQKVTITVSATEHGEVYPSGSFSVYKGSYPVISLKADKNSKISSVVFDSVSKGSVPTILMNNIDANHTLAVTFEVCFTGSGTSDLPFLLHTVNDMKNLSTNVNNGALYSGDYFKMNNDIDMNSVNWIPIGTSETPFCGNFDGGGNSIRNLKIGSQSTPASIGFCGLFGYILNSSIINLGMDENCSIYNNSNYTAGIASFAGNSVIANCYHRGSIKGGSNATGGITGFFYGKVVNCFNTGSITAAEGKVGGVLGDTMECFIDNCYNTGAITGATAGGIAGRIAGISRVLNCYYLEGSAAQGVGSGNGVAERVSASGMKDASFAALLNGYVDDPKNTDTIKLVKWTVNATRNGGYPLLIGIGVGRNDLAGDANDSGEVDLSDAVAILRHVAALEILEGENLNAADANGDGDVNWIDAIAVLRHIAGLDFLE